MNKLRIEVNNRQYHWHLPENFDELTSNQLQWLSFHLDAWRGILVAAANAKFTKSSDRGQMELAAETIRIKVLIKLSGTDRLPRWSKKAQAFYIMEPDEVAQLLSLIDFVYKEPNRTLPPFKRLAIGWTYFYPPLAKMENLSAEEFHYAHLFYKQWKEGDPSALDMLCAILYRTKGKGAKHNPKKLDAFSGDVRTPLNAATLEQFAKEWKTVKQPKKMAIAIWWESFYLQTAKANPQVFTKAEGKENSGMGFLPVFRALAKDPLKIEEVAKMQLSLVLYELRESHREAKELKAKFSRR